MRAVIQAFAEVMEGKLAENDHKPEWAGASRAHLLALLMDEVRELCEALEDGALPADVASECADIANCALFLADLSGALGDYDDRGRVRLLSAPAANASVTR